MATHSLRVRSTLHNGHRSATEWASMVCILYVRNGDRYGGLRIRAGKHRRPVLGRADSRAKSGEMRKDIGGNQRSSLRPQIASQAYGTPREGRRIGCPPGSIGWPDPHVIYSTCWGQSGKKGQPLCHASAHKNAPPAERPVGRILLVHPIKYTSIIHFCWHGASAYCKRPRYVYSAGIR